MKLINKLSFAMAMLLTLQSPLAFSSSKRAFTHYSFGTEQQPQQNVNDELKNPIKEHDPYKLSDRVKAYLPPDSFSDKDVKDLNTEIPSLLTEITDKELAGKPLKKEIGADHQNTQKLSDVIDLSRYFDMDAVREEEKKKAIVVKHLKGEITQQEYEQSIINMVFPVKTTMHPTRMPAKRMELSKEYKDRLVTPIVAIGTDKYSLEWFEMNLKEIRKFHPPVFVTQVDSIEDFMQLERLAPDLTFVPANSEVALRNMGVSFYPVMITNAGIFQ